MPTVGAAITTSAISCQDCVGSVNRTVTIAPHDRPMMHGNSRPRRSDTRPTTGLTPDSSTAAASQVAPIAAAPTPSSSSRSGASTPIVPNSSPGTAISQMPPATRPSRSAASSSRGGDVPSGAAGGVASAQPISTQPKTATPQKTGAMPIASARVPIAGPASVPAIAAAIAVPIISPRRSRGAADATQAIAPAHEHAPPTPWTKRARSSSDDRAGEREREARDDAAGRARAAPSRARRPWRRDSRRGARRPASRTGRSRSGSPRPTSTARTRPRSAAAAA